MKKFENEVCSYALSIELNYYGIKIEPCFYWFKEFDEKDPVLIDYRSDLLYTSTKIIPAYTVGELGELLLEVVFKYSVYIYPKQYKLFNGRDDFGTCEAMSEADLRAYMLIRAIECIKMGVERL
jgi:hypothetical protein